MRFFRSEKFIEVVVPDLRPVADQVIAHFAARDYDTQLIQTENGDWEIAITKGGTFKAVAGQRTALKIELMRRPAGTMVRAGAAVFSRQAIPGIISWVVWPPLLMVPIWGLIRQSGLDDEAVSVVETSLNRYQRAAATDPPPAGDPAPVPPPAAPVPTAGAGGSEPGPFCDSCGATVPAEARFCSECGHRLPNS